MSEYLYLFLDLGSLCIPLLYSILEKDFHFIKYFKYAVSGIVWVAVPFLIWDILFSHYGIWGFNPMYHLPFTLFGLPIEEWLFFFCIPFACLFTCEVIKYYFPKYILSRKLTVAIAVFLLLAIGAMLIYHFGKWYTTVNFIMFLFVLSFALKKHLTALQQFFPSFLIILLPFFLVNGILTGSFTQEPVVWYNNDENMGFRIFTIPFEDIFYAFTLLFSIQLIFNYLKERNHKNLNK